MDGRVRRAAAAVLLSVVIVACGDGGDSATGASGAGTPEASAPDATTTPAETTGPSPTTTPDLSDEVQGCIDAFVRFLVDIEDIVSGFDFAEATLFDFQSFSLALVPAGEALLERVRGMRCADPDGTPSDDLVPMLLDIARTEAPGSVAYLELLIASSELDIAGSCTEDIATLQGYVDDGGTVADLPVEERFHAFSLAASIDGTCSLRTAGEFLNRDEVARFLGIG
jgi:hypothetical protein